MPTIKKTASGKYHTTVFIGYDPSGKRKYKSITASTQREVKQLVAKALTETPEDLSYSSLTLAQAYERYINSKSNTLSPSTYREYTRASKSDFPMLLPYKLSQLNNELIQTAVNEISAYNAPKTVRNKYFFLRTIISTYRPDLHLDIRMPQKIKSKVIKQTDNTIHLLLSHADEKIRVPILLAAFVGLRREEICALAPEDFNEYGVNITKAKVRGMGGYYIKTTKSTAGDRFIPMSKELIAECKQWKYFGRNPDTLTKNYTALREKLEIKATFHKLRHYYGTNEIKQGIDLLTACAYGGWEDPKVLLEIYAHETRDETTDEKVISIYQAYNQKIAMQ